MTEFSFDLNLNFIINLVIESFLLIIIIFLIANVSNLKKRLKKFLPENKEFNIEELLVTYNSNVLNVLEKETKIFDSIEKTNENIKNSVDDINKKINATNENLAFAIQKFAFLRYNPFEEVGGDFSYVIAFLDQKNNGIVINSIYSRENCYSYAKEITNGLSSKYKLSAEEEKTLKMAIEKDNLNL